MMHSGHLKLYDRIYGQDIWETTQLCHVGGDSHAEKVDYRLKCIGHLALWDRNSRSGEATLCIMV